MTFDRFASIPLGVNKNVLEENYGSFKTEMTNPNVPGETYWILRDPRTGYQKAALTFDDRTQSLVTKLWVVGAEEAEQEPETARKRFKTAHFILIDLPSDNPHLLYGEKLLVDEKNGITIEIDRDRSEVSAIQWRDPAYRSPARDLGDQKSQYTF
ncbi:MAG: hypothetical protein HYW49_09965 [Deltaproteobacteria bacterium]|nr:hypothetical protein [Deltaproteobacteria bacterium]